MNRAKMRKVLAAMPAGLPEKHLRQGLALIHNDRTRARVEARFRRRAAARL